MVDSRSIKIIIGTNILVSSTIFNIALNWIAANRSAVFAFALALITSTNFFIAQSKATQLVEISQ